MKSKKGEGALLFFAIIIILSLFYYYAKKPDYEFTNQKLTERELMELQINELKEINRKLEERNY
jgi:preprotein translocase subunit SecG